MDLQFSSNKMLLTILQEQNILFDVLILIYQQELDLTHIFQESLELVLK